MINRKELPDKSYLWQEDQVCHQSKAKYENNPIIFLIDVFYETGKLYRQTEKQNFPDMKPEQKASFKNSLEHRLTSELVKLANMEDLLTIYDQWNAAKIENKEPAIWYWDYYMKDIKTVRNCHVPVTLSQDVGDFLRAEAERRGFTISAFCAQILGNWKVDIENERLAKGEKT